MKARPNLNGNAPEDFILAGNKLLTVVMDLRVAMSEVGALIHGRNYQTYQEDAQKHLSDDDKCFVDQMMAVESLHKYAHEVFYAAAINNRNANEEN